MKWQMAGLDTGSSYFPRTVRDGGWRLRFHRATFRAASAEVSIA